MKKLIGLFLLSWLVFGGFIKVANAQDVSIDTLVNAIEKSKVGVVDIKPGTINVSTSCTFTATKTTDGFSYTPSCIVENVFQPTETVHVSYSSENNTISFPFPGTTIGTNTDYMHYWIAEALGYTNVKDTLNNSTYKNKDCDLLNTGYCKENGIITYELSDKNYNYLINGGPSIGEPPLLNPTEEQIKSDLETIKKKVEDLVKKYKDFDFKNMANLSPKETAEVVLVMLIGNPTMTIKENGISFIYEKFEIFVNYDGYTFSSSHPEENASFSLMGIETLIEIFVLEKNGKSINDYLGKDKAEKDIDYENYIVGNYETNGFEIEYKTVKKDLEVENGTGTQTSTYPWRFKLSSHNINYDNVVITNLDDGKGTNNITGTDNEENKENNSAEIENPNTGFGVLILILCIITTTCIIISSKHQKYYKI